jgi:tetratricopeptide (TPR) repeat protein
MEDLGSGHGVVVDAVRVPGTQQSECSEPKRSPTLAPEHTLPDLDTIWNYQDPEASEARFRALLPRAKEQRAYHIELLTQLARSVCLQRRYDDAHAILDEAEACLTDDLRRPRLRCHLERSRILNDTGHPQASIAQAQKARDIGDEIGELHLTADALHMIAYVVPDDEEAIHWHDVAIEFCEAHVADERMRRWLSTLYINVGDKYEALGRFAEGIDSVNEGIDVAEKLGLTTKVLRARCLLARLHRLDDRLAQAKTMIESVRNAGFAEGWVHEELAECLQAAGKPADAAREFRRAHELFSKDPWYPPTRMERLARIKRLAGEAP